VMPVVVASDAQSTDPAPPSQQSDPPTTAPSQDVPALPPETSEPNDQSSAPEPTTAQPARPPANKEVPAPAPPAPHEPLGTAAAETLPTTGVAAARPAGAAVAPAKQRRVRSIMIKMGLLVGAGVAIGTTMALSQGSPSKPPGAN